MTDKTPPSKTEMNPGLESERGLKTTSDNDTYRKTVTGNDATKQDENFTGTEQTSSGNSLDERDTNDGDANNENNY